MYLVVNKFVVSSDILALRDKKMMPVYYVSHVLAWAEMRDSPLEKYTFNLVVLTRKLKTYFQAHPMTLLTNVPLQQVSQISQDV